MYSVYCKMYIRYTPFLVGMYNAVSVYFYDNYTTTTTKYYYYY